MRAYIFIDFASVDSPFLYFRFPDPHFSNTYKTEKNREPIFWTLSTRFPRLPNNLKYLLVSVFVSQIMIDLLLALTDCLLASMDCISHFLGVSDTFLKQLLANMAFKKRATLTGISVAGLRGNSLSEDLFLKRYKCSKTKTLPQWVVSFSYSILLKIGNLENQV